MAAQIRSFDWASTSIGPVDSWSPALRTTTRILLANRFPILLWWGPEYVCIYNDAYRPILGTKHPWALGQPVRDVWNEIWDILRPLIDRPFRGGEATWDEDIALEINRRGFTEETHFTIAYSPVPDETVRGGIGGVLATVHEITEQVVGARRVAALRDLGTPPTRAKTAGEACVIAAATLGRHDKDVPFALLYLIDEDESQARLAACVGVEADNPLSPPTIDLGANGGDTPWNLSAVARTQASQTIDHLPWVLGDQRPPGPWPDPPERAVVIPLRSSHAQQLSGFLIAGVSARLQLDDQYLGFLELAAGQIGGSISDARALEEAEQRAEALAALDRAKTAFFSNVSHEFRTPLTLLLAPLEDMFANADGLASPAELERLGIARRNARRLLRLVNTLLDFSRLEAGRVEAAFEPTDLAPLTIDLASQFRSAIERAGLELVIDAPPLPEPVYVDREMWEKIVLNLLSNAFKSTFQGSINVTIRPTGSGVELEVADTGIGIAPDELDQIFQRFHRIEDARSRTHEGTGIGLSLVQELVRLHGGGIRVASQVGLGTTFTVTLPAGSDHLPLEQIRTASSPAAKAAGAAPFVEEALGWLPSADDQDGSAGDDHTSGSDASVEPGASVLVADDNADMRDYLRRLLEPHWRVRTVADGQSALEAIRAESPDVVVSDVMMPGLDGFELLQAIRDDPAIQDTPVILVSARAGEEAKIEGLGAGADDYLVKPFSTRELITRVGTTLRIARQRRESIAALRQAHEKYSALVWSTAESVWEADAEGRIDVDAPGWRSLTGQSLEAWIGLGWMDAIHDDDRARVDEEWLEKTASRTPFELDFRVRSRTGEWRWISMRAAPMVGDRGLRWIGMNSDVTSRKRAEEAREGFIGVLSHELRTPITTIVAASELLTRATGRSGGPARTAADRLDLLEDIHAEAQRLDRLVDDLLVLSRAERSELIVETEPVLVHHAIHAAVGAEAQRNPTARFQVEAETLPVVMADRTYLEQVLRNLLGNAAKYGGDGVDIRVVAQQDGGSIRVRVLDTGPGFPSADASRLFELFYRDPQSKHRKPGAGIGLFVTRTLISAMGGEVWARPRKEGGAEFGFSLPLPDEGSSALASADDDAAPASTDDHLSASEQPGEGPASAGPGEDRPL